MAGEELKDATGLLADFPDNQAGLIDAVHSRNFVVSVTPGIGFVEDDPADVPYTIPMTSGVPVEFLASYPGAPLFVGNFWKLDGNNQLVPSYTDFGVIVPAGTNRLNDGQVLISCQKAGGGTANYEFQGLEGGQLTGEPVVREIGTTSELLIFSGVRLYDVSLAGAIDFQITPIGHSDDLIINDFRISMQTSML